MCAEGRGGRGGGGAEELASGGKEDESMKLRRDVLGEEERKPFCEEHSLRHC